MSRLDQQRISLLVSFRVPLTKDRGVRDGMEGIGEAGEEQNRAANFLSKDYFPRAGN